MQGHGSVDRSSNVIGAQGNERISIDVPCFLNANILHIERLAPLHVMLLMALFSRQSVLL